MKRFLKCFIVAKICYVLQKNVNFFRLNSKKVRRTNKNQHFVDDASAQERRDILTELRMMRRIARHRNVVELIGWCITDGEDHVSVLTNRIAATILVNFKTDVIFAEPFSLWFHQLISDCF